MTSSVMSIWSLDTASFGIVGDERPERAEREGVEKDPEPTLLAARLELALDGVQHLGPPGRIRGVDVEEERLAAASLDLGGDPVRVGQRRLAVEVDAGHRHAGSGERERGGLAEPGGGAEDQRPAGQTDRGILGTVGHQWRLRAARN